ncbi:MAG: RagB/SusD family nutrient uptake outer membrane protein [Bernardetiaceae bacterium]|nr:RagB/SusD family nutrient uptake outer membrane protein [Bernardetiaceae bacterium]
MKKTIIRYTLAACLVWAAPGCGKMFLEQPPLDQITVDNFYQTPEQISAFTASLYGHPWFNLNDKAVYAIGDLAGGNLHSFDPNYDPFLKFSVRQDNPRLAEAWGALFKVVGMANSVINILPVKATSVDPALVSRAVGEAKFMRALAYFYLVRTWGAVPIIENSEALATGDFRLPRHRAEDVYTFILRDLQEAERNCPLRYGAQDAGRVTSGAVKSLMAKVYLYQKDYAKARQKAEEVINSGVYNLLNEYADIFKTKRNNNEESIFAWQWVACPDCWGQQNTNQAYFAPNGQGITETGDGWGSVAPSIDIQRAYEPNDRRKKPSIMTPGDFYPELTSKTNPNGYTYPTTQFISNTHASLRKYIVGSPTSPDGPVFFMRTGVNTNVLRFAEVLLIHAEAVMAGAPSTSDATALASFNRVRQRAGLPNVTSISQDDLLRERRVELFLEHDYWYDLGRIDRARAKAIIAAQERGTYSNATTVGSFRVTPTDNDFIMPIPQQETDRNPRLLEAAAPYQF